MRDHAQELRDSIAETVEEFVPAADARRVLSDVDELVKMIRESQRARSNQSWDGREFS